MRWHLSKAGGCHADPTSWCPKGHSPRAPLPLLPPQQDSPAVGGRTMGTHGSAPTVPKGAGVPRVGTRLHPGTQEVPWWHPPGRAKTGSYSNHGTAGCFRTPVLPSEPPQRGRMRPPASTSCCHPHSQKPPAHQSLPQQCWGHQQQPGNNEDTSQVPLPYPM